MVMSKQRHWTKTTPPFFQWKSQLEQDGKYCSVSQRSRLWLHTQNMPNGTHLCTLACRSLLGDLHADMCEEKKRGQNTRKKHFSRVPVNPEPPRGHTDNCGWFDNMRAVLCNYANTKADND